MDKNSFILIYLIITGLLFYYFISLPATAYPDIDLLLKVWALVAIIFGLALILKETKQ